MVVLGDSDEGKVIGYIVIRGISMGEVMGGVVMGG